MEVPMVNIKLEQIGKRYGYEWIFQNINYTFDNQYRYAVLGANGSGKSTLFQVLAGSLLPSKGTINYIIDNQSFSSEDFFTKITWVAPYIDLIENFTFKEMLAFQGKLKPFLPNYTIPKIIDYTGLRKVANKEIRYFSSGMKQRVKLALALFANSPILLLDEPTTNLDKQGVDWYLETIHNFTTKKLVIVASNQEQEYNFCEKQMKIENFKLSN